MAAVYPTPQICVSFRGIGPPCVPSLARSSSQEMRAGPGLPVASIQSSAPSSTLMGDSPPPQDPRSEGAGCL